MAYIDILILAAVAAFLGYRLWSVLGTHDPDKPIKPKNSLFVDEDEVPIRPTQRSKALEESEILDDGFNKAKFLEGSEMAFRMIVEAFAAGEKKVLKPLLSAEVYENFAKAIDQRKKGGETLELELARIVKAEIVKEMVTNGFKEITVRFLSEQCSVTHGKDGTLIAGNPNQYHEITDVWTFSRKPSSMNPNWTLVSTQSGETDEKDT